MTPPVARCEPCPDPGDDFKVVAKVGVGASRDHAIDTNQ
jgi:hypothetical protein